MEVGRGRVNFFRMKGIPKREGTSWAWQKIKVPTVGLEPTHP